MTVVVAIGAGILAGGLLAGAVLAYLHEGWRRANAAILAANRCCVPNCPGRAVYVVEFTAADGRPDALRACDDDLTVAWAAAHRRTAALESVRVVDLCDPDRGLQALMRAVSDGEGRAR